MSNESLRINELIKIAKVQGLSDDATLDFQVRMVINTADKEKRHLTKDEIRNICRISGPCISEILMIQHKSNDLVTEARKGLMKEQPYLFMPGGALYPSERAEACWSDCWQFLRVVNYAYACNRTEFTEPKGMAALRELYKRIGVPLGGLSTALRYLAILTIKEVGTAKGRAQLTNIFRHLMQELNISAVKT
tara:strand:+ start:1559 stop:2134 length:576 start_codon:yes stop_codon:yes gene_type:complete